MAEIELKERLNHSITDSPVKGGKESIFGPRNASIRVRDKNSIRMTLNHQTTQNRMTFRTNRNTSSFNQFTQALINMPEENENCVIFPWDEDLKEFVIEDEKKVNSVQNITREDIDMVFAKVKESPYFDLYGNMHLKLLTPFLILLLGIVLFLLFYQGQVNGTKNTNMIVTVFFIMFALILLLIIVVSIFWARYLKNRLAKREIDFTEILNQFNSDYFADKDVFWKCGKLGTYIQLDLNYEFKGMEYKIGSAKSPDSKNKISISINADQSKMLAEILQQAQNR